MTKSVQRASEAMAELGSAVEVYLDRALRKSGAQTCDACLEESVETKRGLTISRLGGIVTARAYRSPVEGLESPDISFEVSWSSGVSELPDVSMNLHSGGEITPREITLKDFPWVATVLGDLIETPNLRLVN
jgi:hypothetical protein